MSVDAPCCATEDRRALVRAHAGNGFDYVEVDCDQTTLAVNFLGAAPAWEDARFLRIEGGRRVTGLSILGIDIRRSGEDGVDDVMLVRVDRPGDFSTYRLCAVELGGDGRPTGRAHPDFDPRYACVSFGFKADCPSDLDCAAADRCEVPRQAEPAIDYLAKDYASFRRLMLDRMALTMPDWRERHAADLGIVLVEILAQVADDLSYYQDAVATEAYLDTARLRTSVRRHARLVDYVLHEGCNARTWMVAEVSEARIEVAAADIAFTTAVPLLDDAMLRAEALPRTEPAGFTTFEPLVATPTITLRAARNRIAFHEWGQRDCCIPRGATGATLRDPGTLPRDPDDLAAGIADARWHDLHLAPGEVLVLAEVIGARTGDPADADPARRHAVRLTRATPSWDPLLRVPVWEVEWCAEDALPFALCLSTTGDAPGCASLSGVSIAWGNVILADHGASHEDDLGRVPERGTAATCATACAGAEVAYLPGRYRPALPRADVGFAAALPEWGGRGCGNAAASALVRQDVPAALPLVALFSYPAERPGVPTGAPRRWTPRADLIGSGPDDRHFVVEVDDDRVARLRFGDGDCGRAVEAGERFVARYRTGTGTAGHVGADTLDRIVFRNGFPEGATIRVRNPLPATGGVAFEPVAEARLRAPHAFRTRLERAVVPGDYAAIVMRDFPAEVQRAAAVMRATGVRAAVSVAVDAVGLAQAAPPLLDRIAAHLERYRRIGHDVRVVAAEPVPIALDLLVCVADDHRRALVAAEVRRVLGTGRLAGGGRGFFHPDSLSFGDAITVSALVAAVQRVAGVASVVVRRLERLFEGPNDEIADGVLPLGPLEVARLDGDPDFPENGMLRLELRGGR